MMVNLRRDRTSSGRCHRSPTVRSLVLSEMFLPLENNSLAQSSRSRSACRSCLLVEPSFQEHLPPLSPTVCQMGKKGAPSALQRSDSFLSRLQSLFVIKRPVVSLSKSKKSTAPPKIHPPLLNCDSFSSQFRVRSQSAASRNHHRFLKTTSTQASPARGVVNEPLVCNTPSPKTTTHTPLTSFISSPTKVQRPKNCPQVLRRQRCNNPSQQKHLSAHLPGDTLPSQTSSGLWSASSVTSLGILPQRSTASTEGANKMPSVGGEARSFLRFRRRSSASSNDSAVDLHPSAAASIKSDWFQYQKHASNNSICTSSSIRIYEEVPSTETRNFTEKTPTAAQPQNFARSTSTTTLTSMENEKTEPTYAVPLSNTATFLGPLKPPAPPAVPPKGSTCRREMEDLHLGAMPPALTASPQPPIYVEKAMPQRRAASALRVSYQRSPRIDDSMRGRRPASTISSSDLTAVTNTTNPITSSSGSSWYADILPYNPSNLPDTLADRLKQRNSFILSTPSAPQVDELMTRSLFESRQPSENCAWPPPGGRSASRTRPVSFHDAPSISINLPSLDHLLKPSETRKISAPKREVITSPLKELFLQEPLQVQLSDSPLLGQYCRLKLVFPPAPASVASTSVSSGGRSAAADVCSTFMQSSRF